MAGKTYAILGGGGSFGIHAARAIGVSKATVTCSAREEYWPVRNR